MRQKISKKYKNLGIKYRTLLIVTIVSGIAMTIYIIVFMSVYYKNSMKKIHSNAYEVLANTSNHLLDYMGEISSIAKDANYNYYLQNYLINYNEEQKQSFGSAKEMQNFTMSTKAFDSVINSRSDIAAIMVFRKDGPILYKTNNTYINVQDDFSKYEWFKEAIDEPDKMIVTGPIQHQFFTQNNENRITVTRQISSYVDGSFLGIMLIDINLNEISRICGGVNLKNSGEILLLNKNYEIVYSSPNMKKQYEKNPNSLISKLKSYKKNEGSFKIKIDESYEVILKKIEELDWFIVSLYPRSVINKEFYIMAAIIFLTYIIVILVIATILYFALDRVVKPIITLKEHMDKADQGNLDFQMEIVQEDEIGILTNSFNKMLKRINQLMHQVVVEERKKRKYELQMLQSQINPHFLYNTLESIIWMAEKQDPMIVPMIEALARLFRLTLNNAKELTTIENEIEHVKNYLFIQSFRYKDKFTYSINCQDNLKNVKIIKLIVQPLVENAIYHGIKNQKKKGWISVNAYSDEEKIFIEVEDNGAGMTEECVKKLNEGKAVQSSITGSGIAVSNIIERIKLYYGEQYGVTYKSYLGEGTLAIICLPLKGDIENE